MTKKANYILVSTGKCPHDNAKLEDAVACKGIGVTRVCKKCKHKWYLNEKIHTCKCQTCSTEKRKAKKVSEVKNEN
ncbi:MAG: hypothetical protein JW967_04620 [Dehalococcoidales bacterium]|nr:hypothetical protein [Dehalococcoidales bacterium]